ncbi:lysophospholipid acyltransferase family protein [uncultured Xylophilus sp.]|uniref:lysophospholipid acyltransferase family protein n=1 Tax=uncultured Xylophilus sp. TaxID=296832 RepID=UPI0025F89512|nr:lysophospholipid acyltransferase family protein [uncultured Xylophilus sp.]
MQLNLPWPAARLLRACAHVPRALLLYGVLLVLGVVSLAWNLCAMLLHPLLPRERGRDVGRAAIAYAYRGVWALAGLLGLLRIDVRCLDALHDERGLIIVANHPTMIDALLLVARLPRSACIMKADLMRNVFLGAGARLARYIRNDSPRGLVRCAVDDLRDGGQLIVFPEGTRTVRAPVNPFRPGITLIAKLADAPIQTVFLDTDSPYLRKGWPIWRVPPAQIVVTARLGARFAPSPDSADLLARIEQYYRAAACPSSLPSLPPSAASACPPSPPRPPTSS